jgi:hypothetical protein
MPDLEINRKNRLYSLRMKPLVIGIVCIAFSLFAVLPVSWSLQWGPDVLDFLKGSIPVVVFLIGLLAIFVGIADVKDKNEAKKEERELKKP